MTAGLLILAVLALAFCNGANDVSKGIATLVGSGVTRLKTAVIWGAVWTVAGAITAAFASRGLVQAFRGSGLLSPLPGGFGFLIAMGGGSLAWVWLATRSGLPVSTTHAITGALVGASATAVGLAGIHWRVLWEKFALPLAVSPVLSLGLVLVCLPLFRLTFGRLESFCLCLNHQPALPANLVTSLLVIFASRLALPVSTTHVSSGAIIGLGLRRDARNVQWRTVRDFVLAWVVTLPVAGIIASLLYGLERL
ncbi:MAG: inorganic phosphate transporter [Verrucomicrobia bacterium]|nr:inorganic phosphate transporter [Verrucomicrobiota bacterium]